MKRSEEGFLLLTSHLGDPARKVLTTAQFRDLTKRMQYAPKTEEAREIQERDLVAIGYDRSMAGRILNLLEQEEQLRWYLRRGKDCEPITRVSDGYPLLLRKKLGAEAPGCLWAKGDVTLLERPAVALVGSRALQPENRVFARKVGQEAAKQGYVLVSGNAIGADRTAQDACLEAGGCVISVVADRLDEKKAQPNMLYLSEDGYDQDFSAQRAISRNRVIHCLAQRTFVAQSNLGKGGTWDGTVKNLRNNWSPVFCYRDGSAAIEELAQMGAATIDCDALKAIHYLQPDMMNFIDQA